MFANKKDFRSILELDSELNQIQDYDLLLERILLEARKVLNADAGSIYVLNNVEENGQRIDKLEIRYAQNDTLQKQLPSGHKSVYSIFSFPINEKTISGYCALTKTLLNVKDAYHLPPNVPYSFSTATDQKTGYKTTSLLTVPLKTADGKLLGVIQVINAMKRGKAVPFTKEDEFVITHFASNATTALERASMTRAMILRMIRMAELRDPSETGTHVNRVAGYAVEIYDRWAYHHEVNEREREKFKDVLKIASMLHDVGKVAISDAILKKPSQLLPEERQLMQHHTVYGAGLFDDIHSQVDSLARDIALCHHENWDGTGYPGWVDPVTSAPIKAGPDGKALGRKGEEIPLAGRIVAIADVFDALSSKRAYKPAWNEDAVLTEIRSLGGTKFDPELTAIFFEILSRIRQVQNMYPEQKEV